MDTSDVAANAGKETAPQQPALNVGLTLREAREHLGISVHDVAERIKFAPRQVEALEANDFAHLPQATFLRGFVRSYARMLQLDEAVLIAALPGEPAKQVVAKAQAVDVAFPAIQSLWRVNVLWLAGALGVALVLGLFVLLHDSEPAAKPTDAVIESVPLPTPDAAVSGVADTEPKPETVETAKVAEQTAPEAIKVAEPKMAVEPRKSTELKKSPELKKAPEANKTSEPRKSPEPAMDKQPAVKAAPQIAAASAPVETVKPAVSLEMLKRRPLHFVFGESTWVEVIDVNGAVLLSRTNPRGSEQWIGGPRRAPYEVTIAHPGSVKLYYKGKEIDLSAYAGMETARLKVE